MAREAFVSRVKAVVKTGGEGFLKSRALKAIKSGKTKAKVHGKNVQIICLNVQISSFQGRHFPSDASFLAIIENLLFKKKWIPHEINGLEKFF